MNSSKIFRVGALLLFSSVVVLTACEKTFDDKTPVQANLNNKSQVQVFIATVNANRNVVMVDGKRVSRPTLASGLSFPTGIFPSTGTGTSFSVDGGLRSFQILDTLASTTQKPLTFTTNLETNKLYSIFAYDTITSPKQITVETPIVLPAENVSRIRFANFIHDANDVPPVDVYSMRLNKLLFSNVSRTQVSDFVEIPSSPFVSDTLEIRQAGTNIRLATYPNAVQTAAFLPATRKSYTIIYRGSHRGTRTASVFANY